jgi:hypothetical protein
MKTNQWNPMFVIGLFVFFLSCSKIYSQDSIAQKSQLLDMKLQLLDSRLELFDAKIKLWEAKPKELDSRLWQLDSKIKSMDFDPQMMTRKLNELDSLLRLSQVNVQTRENIPQFPDETVFQFPANYKSAITLDPARLLEGTFHLSYERILSDNFSLNIGGLATYSTSRGISNRYFSNQSYSFFDKESNFYHSYNGEVMSGGGFTIQFRNYLRAKFPDKPKAPLGLYAAPQFMYRNMKITGYYSEMEEREPDVFEMVDKQIVQHLNIFAGGVILGIKVPLYKVLAVDLFAGGNIRLSKYKNETGFTKYKDWTNFDFSGVSPVAGIGIGILK